jgi:hypothetical protein
MKSVSILKPIFAVVTSAPAPADSAFYALRIFRNCTQNKPYTNGLGSAPPASLAAAVIPGLIPGRCSGFPQLRGVTIKAGET